MFQNLSSKLGSILYGVGLLFTRAMFGSQKILRKENSLEYPKVALGDSKSSNSNAWMNGISEKY